MAGFPSNLGAASLATILGRVTGLSGSIKQNAQNMVTASASTVLATRITTYANGLGTDSTNLAALASTSGLAAYAQAQYNDGTLDIVAAYNTMAAQITATLAWVATNYPKAASGELLERKLNSAGVITEDSFTSAQLAGFVTQLNALIATIN